MLMSSMILRSIQLELLLRGIWPKTVKISCSTWMVSFMSYILVPYKANFTFKAIKFV